MANPLISVVITIFKNTKRVSRVLNTVINQTYDNLEIIVVDGANLDRNKKAVEEFKDKRIKYVRVEPEAVRWPGAKAVQHQRNIGCKLAKGNWIAMLDDDDEWEPSKIEKQVNVLKIKRIWVDNLSLITCWSKIFTEKGYFIERANRHIYYKDLLKNFNLSSTSTYLVKKSALEAVGWWDEDVQGMHEYDIALKMAKKGYRIYSVNEPLMLRNRNYEEQLGSVYWKIAEQFQFWNRYGSDVAKHLNVLEFLLKGINTVGLISVYCLGYIFQNKIWNIIYPIKDMYEGNK